MYTHQSYIDDVVNAAKQMVANDPEKLAKINNVKLVYGAGSGTGARGVTFFRAWKGSKGNEHLTIGANGPPTDDHKDLVEICAFGQENWTQVAGTCVHELAHVIAGPGHGHDKEWKKACDELGLRCAKAAGMNYLNAAFAPKLRNLIQALPKPEDGSPSAIANALGVTPRLKPCTLGIGTKGGKSRGTGSGSRLLKCSCDQCGYTVRTTQKWVDVAIPKCPVDDSTMTVS